MNEQEPLPYTVAVPALVRCVGNTALLLARRQVRLPRTHVGVRLQFANGTSARVFRETVVDVTPQEPCVLCVEFRLKVIRGPRGHALFRWESLFNTPLFVGFPGFVSKLWVANDQCGVYRGIYQWDGAERAQHYAQSLWRVLALGCVAGSIHFMVLPGMQRDAVLAAPHLLDGAPGGRSAWWRLSEAS